MSNFRVFSTKCVTFLRNTSNISSSTTLRRFLSQKSYTYYNPESQSRLTKLLTQICGGCIACGLSVYCLKDRKFFTNKFIVNALEPSDDNIPRMPYSFLADIVEMAQPAVVYIEVKIRNPYGQGVVKSHGSGFIVREDGLVLTNAHVISRQTVVDVKLQDGRVVKGQVQAVDSVTDLATVKINEKNLPVLKLGKSSASRPGEFVLAMGSPLTLNNSVTHGIISTVNRGSRELGMEVRDMEYIQTDAVITKGNSGGPLVNMKGEAIGINTLNVMAGISFAIPSDRAAEFLRKAEELEKRAAKKGWFGMGSKAVTTKQNRYIGITMFTLSPEFLSDLQSRAPNFPQHITSGVLVPTVIHGSPAHRAGIQPGDVIVKINDKDIKSSAEVYKILETSDTLIVQVYRQNQKFQLTITPDTID
ncbi:serine protease HTRA2, mitochondrial-like isoform X1 [Mytilus californianus]|uniref:serine protease HTRA2, mitochondrial-like isoform X1 n=1 Tax=Mytilus californianus TaxID=6549 RepID=UPI002247BE1F|nr:serine protease HTRA2, mitochondrial-like isoform X1 [Mytilus californianus]XP_052066515.1 serine protease HTRA2, mitochondrial-like isoform X1 [Mytilus californianus]XP_052066516.1 serine protease HTRA2, mitochondrial-like isoform X1 [Mytilus californianus]